MLYSACIRSYLVTSQGNNATANQRVEKMNKFEIALNIVVKFDVIGISSEHCAAYVMKQCEVDAVLLAALAEVIYETKNTDCFLYAIDVFDVVKEQVFKNMS